VAANAQLENVDGFSIGTLGVAYLSTVSIPYAIDSERGRRRLIAKESFPMCSHFSLEKPLLLPRYRNKEGKEGGDSRKGSRQFSPAFLSAREGDRRGEEGMSHRASKQARWRPASEGRARNCHGRKTREQLVAGWPPYIPAFRERGLAA